MRYLSRIHPVLFILSSLTYLILPSREIVSPDQLLRPFILLVIFLSILAYPIYWLIRDWDWAAVFYSVLVITLFTSPGYFLIAALVCVVGFVLLFAYTCLSKRAFTLGRISMGLNLAGIFLLFLNCYLFIASGGSGVPVSYIWMLSTRRSALFSLPIDQPSRPDIYYIILDSYGREDILQEFYGFDNSEFLNKLRDKGFIIPERSRSNYPRTALSVASTLNMDYIDEIVPGLQDTNYWWLMSPLIDKSDVRLGLEQMGYQTVSLTTEWGITDNPSTQIYFKPTPVILNDFEGFILNVTPLRYLRSFLSRYTIFPSYAGHRAFVEYNFETLAEISKLGGPQFVFAHIISPHPPFVFDKNGNAVDPKTPFSFNDADGFPSTADDYRKGYTGQIQYINKKLLLLVDSILKNSETPPIIILQADHGPGMLVDFRSLEDTCLRERFSIFAGYYLPGTDHGIVPDDVTPVNLFRIIFNAYFGTNFKYLERAHYFDVSNIYRLEDVTSRVDSCLD